MFLFVFVFVVVVVIRFGFSVIACIFLVKLTGMYAVGVSFPSSRLTKRAPGASVNGFSGWAVCCFETLEGALPPPPPPSLEKPCLPEYAPSQQAAWLDKNEGSSNLLGIRSILPKQVMRIIKYVTKTKGTPNQLGTLCLTFLSFTPRTKAEKEQKPRGRASLHATSKVQDSHKVVLRVVLTVRSLRPV